MMIKSDTNVIQWMKRTLPPLSFFMVILDEMHTTLGPSCVRKHSFNKSVYECFFKVKIDFSLETQTRLLLLAYTKIITNKSNFSFLALRTFGIITLQLL